MSGLVLAVETSCDETAVAVVERGRTIVSSVVASQVALHAPAGGVVPEAAARAHLRWMIPVLDEARTRAGLRDWSGVDAIAVTHGPGLAGSLLVGITLASTLAWLTDRPLVPVNHHEGHLYAAWLTDADDPGRPEPELPAIALVVSGGHTFLLHVRDHLDYERLGGTVDDAAGEAFDKVGRLLGLPYPGGPAIAAAAAEAHRRDLRMPRAWLGDSFDFSFSGLKTAARRKVGEATGVGPDAPEIDGAALPKEVIAELAWAFEDAVVDVLAAKTLRAAEERDTRSIVLVGGVAANRALRERLTSGAAARGLPLHVPPPELCTDNAAMIGGAGWRRFQAGERAGLDLDAVPGLRLAA